MAHAFNRGVSKICGDIHFDPENWTSEKAKPGDGKYTLFSVAVHEIGHELGLYHCNEKDSVMAPFQKHGFSTENKHEILSESYKALIQQMYGKPTEGLTVEVKAVFNSKKAKVMIRTIIKNSKPEKVKVKVVFTFKPRFFAKCSEDTGDTGA